MSAPKKITVQQRDDGRFEGVRPGAQRASVVRDTQRETVNASREILRNDGGGELAIRRVTGGQIRSQDTIAPANDPRSSKG